MDSQNKTKQFLCNFLSTLFTQSSLQGVRHSSSGILIVICGVKGIDLCDNRIGEIPPHEKGGLGKKWKPQNEGNIHGLIIF